MNVVKEILETRKYLKMTFKEIEEVAFKEFPKLDDDSLKIELLTKGFEKLPESELSMTPRKCAEVLVSGGTYEGGQ